MLELEQLSYVVRGCVYEVYRQLGCGYLEKVYERALLRELSLQGLNAERQVPFKISYKNEIIGEYYADIVVEKSVILELKAQQSMPRESEAQLLNYLKATGLKVGLLINFGEKSLKFKRFIKEKSV